MTYQLTFDDAAEVAILSYSEPTDISEQIESRCKIISLCQEQNCKKALILLGDVLAHQSFSKAELKLYGESIDKEMANEITFAVVMPDSIESQNEMYFPIHIMKQNGILMKTFYTKDDALSWLTRLD
ncbi:MAG: hypothetical protein PVF28_02490 [Thioalkalispiraceae bacterium]|jgi:hypothetical protein